MTKGARAFRDLARREGGDPAPKGAARPPPESHRAQACVLPSSTGDAGAQPAAGPPHRPDEGCAGARAGKPRAPRREWQRPGGHGSGAQAGRGDPGRFRRRAAPGARLLESSGVAQTRVLPAHRPHRRDPPHPGAFSLPSLALGSWDVSKEDPAARPEWLLLPAAHPVSRAAAGWRDPLGSTGPVDSRFGGAPGQVEGRLRRKAGTG